MDRIFRPYQDKGMIIATVPYVPMPLPGRCFLYDEKRLDGNFSADCASKQGLPPQGKHEAGRHVIRSIRQACLLTFLFAAHIVC